MEESIFKSQWELKVKPTKLPTARENVGNQIVIGSVLHMIGREGDASFLDQSKSGHITFDIQLKNRSKQSNNTLSTFFHKS